MSGWTEFILAFVAFLAAHLIPMRPALKSPLIAVLGRAGYIAAFSLLSLGLLYWLLMAAGRAPFVEVWPQAGWQRWLVNLAMPLAIVLTVFAVGVANPFSFGGKTAGFDPDRPGIIGLTRHPLMWAFAIWAGAHLLANGDLAHVLVFAPFLALSLAGIAVVERRRAAAMGPALWARMTARTSALPFAALILGRWRPTAPPPLGRTAAALGIWAALWHLHAPVIGVWPAP